MVQKNPQTWLSGCFIIQLSSHYWICGPDWFSLGIHGFFHQLLLCIIFGEVLWMLWTHDLRNRMRFLQISEPVFSKIAILLLLMVGFGRENVWKARSDWREYFFPSSHELCFDRVSPSTGGLKSDLNSLLALTSGFIYPFTPFWIYWKGLRKTDYDF